MSLLRPSNVANLLAEIVNCEKVDDIDLSEVSRLVEHVPEDMTATVEAGMSLADFQQQLAKGGQWLPVDPPNPDSVTIGELLANNLNGPRRFGCGTVRDWLIGVAVVLPDGRLIRNGGKVVKNVAGFDLCRLFIGAQNTLGIIVEATFKLQPLPEAEMHLAKRFESLGQAEACLEHIWDSTLQPIVLDLHRIDGSDLTMVVSFAGPSADVTFQSEELIAMGFEDGVSLDYDARFRSKKHTWKSIAPGNLINSLSQLPRSNFVARAGNGLIYHDGEPCVGEEDSSLELNGLERRLKQEFDPENKLPELRRQ